ncbi:hypothetical protein [Caballeronia sp. KNU42]
MTLDQLRADIARGPLSTGAHTVERSLIDTPLASKLFRIAEERRNGARLQLPHNHMPILP